MSFELLYGKEKGILREADRLLNAFLDFMNLEVTLREEEPQVKLLLVDPLIVFGQDTMVYQYSVGVKATSKRWRAIFERGCLFDRCHDVYLQTDTFDFTQEELDDRWQVEQKTGKRLVLWWV